MKEMDYHPEINIENHDTIGMIALDKMGNMAGACTTSGLAWKMHGRVGDSPIIGAGLYIDNEVGGATATGHGEEVIRTVGSFRVVEYMKQGRSPQEACVQAVKDIRKIFELRKADLSQTQIGFLALNKNGQTGGYSLRKGFQYALSNPNQQLLTDAPFLL
jgi:N4-(beta-N-acetylglucosaminyl)-L-asparaginase